MVLNNRTPITKLVLPPAIALIIKKTPLKNILVNENKTNDN